MKKILILLISYNLVALDIFANFYENRSSLMQSFKDYVMKIQGNQIESSITKAQIEEYVLKQKAQNEKIDFVVRFGNNFQNTDFGILSIYNIDLRLSRFGYANLSFANLNNIDLTNSLFYAANLSNSSLENTLLNKANLSKANLSNANLSGASLIYANLSDANLSGANLSRANLSGANLSRANLSGANLKNSILIATNLSEANLDEAFLLETNIYGSIFNHSSMKNTHIYRTKMIDCDLSEVIIDKIDAREVDSRGSNKTISKSKQ